MSRNVVHIEAQVRYTEDAYIDKNHTEDSATDPKMPFLVRIGTRKVCGNFSWNIDIDIDSGEIIGWKEKYPEFPYVETFYKVCDCCKITYGDIKYDDYVPDFLCLDDSGYGDYMYLTIENGKIKKWSKGLFEEFVEEQNERAKD